jgi:hypothetical protein
MNINVPIRFRTILPPPIHVPVEDFSSSDLFLLFSSSRFISECWRLSSSCFLISPLLISSPRLFFFFNGVFGLAVSVYPLGFYMLHDDAPFHLSCRFASLISIELHVHVVRTLLIFCIKNCSPPSDPSCFPQSFC